MAGKADRSLVADDDDPGVQGVERECLRLTPDATAPRQARAAVRAVLGADVARRVVETAILLTSEIVTNAVIHPEAAAGPGLVFLVVTDAHRVRVEVSDTGAGFDPVDRPRRSSAQGGRGLLLVDQLAGRWGVAGPGGSPRRFTVWFELELDARP